MCWRLEKDVRMHCERRWRVSVCVLRKSCSVGKTAQTDGQTCKGVQL